MSASFPLLAATPLTDGLIHVANGIPVLAAAGASWLLAKWVFDYLTPFDGARELSEVQNPAYGLIYGTYLLAMAFALSGSLFGRAGDGLLIAVGRTLGEGAFVVSLMWLSLFLHDRVLFHHFDVREEIGRHQNVGAACCFAGSALSSGLILNGALLGYSGSFAISLRDILIFWSLGQGTLYLGVQVYRWITHFDIHRLITTERNAAVGLGFGGFLIALGIVLRASLLGTGTEPLGAEILRVVLFALISLASLGIVRVLVDLLMLPKADLNLEIATERNLAAAMLAVSVYLTVAVLLASILQRWHFWGGTGS